MKYGKLSNYELRGQQIYLDFEGVKARIEVLTPTIINVFCGFKTKEHHSKAIEGEKTIATEVRVEKKKDGLWISTQEVLTRVTDGFYVDFYDKNGQEVCVDYRGDAKPLERIREKVT